MYADGACKGNPGVGGWGVFLAFGEHEKSLCGGELHTTNNRMELLAVIQGLKILKRACNVHIYTDSVYVHKGMTEWLSAWQARGWKTSDKKPVKNEDLWRELVDVSKQHTIQWHWVKGHSGNEGNEKADELANQGVMTVLAESARSPSKETE
jgi:ribonuclease HI